MRFRPVIHFLLWCLLPAAAAYGQNPNQIIALSVSQVDAGSPSFTLQVMGGNFVQGSTVLWGTRALVTSLVDSSDLSAIVTSDLLAISGGNKITVQNPNGALSGFAYVYVEPVVYSITPTSVPALGPSQTITVTGAGFDQADAVEVNTVSVAAAVIPTTYVSPSTLTAVIPAATLAHIADAAVLVVEQGCCVSRTLYLPIGNPPVITSVTPSSLAPGSPAFTLTVFGSAFQSAAVVYWNGSPITTSFVNSSQLSAQVPSSPALSQPGPISLYVLNPDGGTSNPSSVTVQAAGPAITALKPLTATAGMGDFTLTVNGSGFVSGSKVLWNSNALVTTFGNASQLTATVPAALTAVPGTAQIAVQNPAPSPPFPTSAAVTFAFPGPQISALQPSTLGAGSAAFTLVVSGSGFLPTSTIVWGNTPLATTFVSATQLQSAVSAALIAVPATVNVTVSNFGTISNATPFNAAAPSILTISPTTASAGSNGVTMTVNGSAFARGAQVQWNTTLLSTTFLATTQLTAPVPASLMTTPGTASVTVVNPGGVTSGPVTFTLNPPVISSLSPGAAPAGSASFYLTVSGSGFAGNSQVLWNQTPLVTSFLSVSGLYANVPASLVAAAGTATVSVSSPGGATSNTASFTITAGGPVISSLSPASATAGGVAFVLTVNGAGFYADSVVQWNSTRLTTTYVSITQLTAAVPASLIAAPGTAAIMVTASEGPSNPVTFPVNPLGPSISAGGVVNAASPAPSIAPGSLISIFGTGLATSTAPAGTIPLLSTLGGASVSINGIPAPMLYASPTQINAQVPFEVKAGTATVVVSAGGLSSPPVTFPVSATGPGIFVIQNYSDGSLNSAQHPVASGQYVVLYMTGQGAVDHPVPDGAAASGNPLSNSVAQVTATVGGQNATVLFAGLAPGFVGVLQVDLQIPAVPSGSQPLAVTIGGVASNIVTIAIQ